MFNLIRAQLAAVVTTFVITPALLTANVSRADDAAPRCLCQYSLSDPGQDLYSTLIIMGYADGLCDTHPRIVEGPPSTNGANLKAVIRSSAGGDYKAAVGFTPTGTSACETATPNYSVDHRNISPQQALTCITAINQACRNAGFQ